ncbi:hypothetical protein Taro_055783 [Colocasia esculenta]|uniref:Uncharacterized protein n=1 Tax=Colocasia esculenta TaxID=4460 RepID=A0A843XTX4_COLES|nr:hypothetical protein [Colocasia esculenta]
MTVRAALSPSRIGVSEHPGDGRPRTDACPKTAQCQFVSSWAYASFVDGPGWLSQAIGQRWLCVVLLRLQIAVGSLNGWVSCMLGIAGDAVFI